MSHSSSFRLLCSSLALVACGPLDDEAVHQAPIDAREELITATSCPVASPEVVCSGTGRVWSSLYRVGRSSTALGEIAQTFTVETEGVPESVRLQLRLLRDVTASSSPVLTVAVRPLSGGAIPVSAATDLARATVQISTLPRGMPNEVSLTLAPTNTVSPASLTPGTTYALVLTATEPTTGAAFVGVASHPSNTFPRGAVWRRSAHRQEAGFPATSFPPGADGADLSFSLKVKRRVQAICSNGSASNCNPTGTTLLASSAFVDPTPPGDWVQCAGFVNTTGNDVAHDFVNNCLGASRLRLRAWNAAGVLEDDVYQNITPRAHWPTWTYLGTGSLTRIVTTYWNAGSGFFTNTDGNDACRDPAAPSGITLGTGNGSIGIIAGGNTNAYEYRLNCGGASLVGRKVALYR